MRPWRWVSTATTRSSAGACARSSSSSPTTCSAPVVPGEEELRGFLSENLESFRGPGTASFEQIYFDVDRRGEAAEADARRLLSQLQSAGGEVEIEGLGDRLLLPSSYTDTPMNRVAARFGSMFVERLVDLPIGAWVGPVESGYGVHLVLVRARQPGEVPAFDEIREAIEHEWRAKERATAKEAFFQQLKEQYEVIVEGPKG